MTTERKKKERQEFLKKGTKKVKNDDRKKKKEERQEWLKKGTKKDKNV